jgi:acetylornithine/succinyldiaminopimelate/putrescine aminotransferase
MRMAGQRPLRPYDTIEALDAAFRAHMNPGKADFFASIGMQLVLGRREGIWFEDAYSGRRYINCHCNGGVFNLGHCHPRVTAAVREALGTVDIGNHHFLSGLRAKLAERLSATTGDRLPRVVYGVGGGEAGDLAIKVARAATGRQGIVSAHGGYHGHTGLVMATGDPTYREPFGPNPPGFSQVPFDDVGEMDAVVGDDTAAVILEAIPATLGMPIPREGYFAEVRRMCSERGAKLIIDEIQTGLGRTGKHWCHHHDGIVPDAVLTGKGLSGGIYPISATLLTEDLHRVLDENPFVHISTYGGAELGCVAALAVLDVIEEPGFMERVGDLGERFEAAFAPLPFELRRRGLFMGLAFASEDASLGTLMKLLEAGVFAFPAGNDRKVLQFLPPLILSDAECDDLISRVRGVFA